MKYRSRMDITAAILEITLEGSIKTRTMYGAFLSFPQLKEYRGLLTDAGLIEHADEGRTFTTTERGKCFTKMCREVDSMVPKENMRTKNSQR